MGRGALWKGQGEVTRATRDAGEGSVEEGAGGGGVQRRGLTMEEAWDRCLLEVSALAFWPLCPQASDSCRRLREAAAGEEAAADCWWEGSRDR